MNTLTLAEAWFNVLIVLLAFGTPMFIVALIIHRITGEW